MPTVLVVENEWTLRELLRDCLEREGVAVVAAETGVDALARAATTSVDLAIVDMVLPDVSGEAVVRELHDVWATPVLILGASSEEADRVRGFELGADDYVTKPFSPRELVLRVRVILRRELQAGSAAVGEERLSYGEGSLVLDEPRRHAVVRGKTVDLTPSEWKLLLALAQSAGRVYSRAELIREVRGYAFEGYERCIDTHVKNLRRKVERDPHRPEIVETVLGFGYRLGMDADRQIRRVGDRPAGRN